MPERLRVAVCQKQLGDQSIAFDTDPLCVRAFRVRCHYEAAVVPVGPQRTIRAVGERANRRTFRQGERLIRWDVHAGLPDWHIQEPGRCAAMTNGNAPRLAIQWEQSAGFWQVIDLERGLDRFRCSASLFAVLPVAWVATCAELCGIDARCPEKWQRIERQSHIIGDTWQLFSIPRIINH